MATPKQIRSTLLRLVRKAKSEVRTVASSSQDPATVRAALFAATPLIVGDYSDGSSALALEWYEELRDAAETAAQFTPRPLVLVPDDEITAIVAETTRSIYDFERGVESDLSKALAEATQLLEVESERLIVSAYTDTMTGNVADDPDAVGWRRFARPEACKFCLMLAAKGAVYTEATARFAAHGAVVAGKRKGGNCMCIAGPAFGGKDIWAEATPEQYVASKRRRTAKERADLREYLNHNFPDAPG